MLKELLKKYFGFSDFREGQEEIITQILDKKNVLAIMPTGAGKSLCYQLPALISPNYSIIISPLISLMQDQVASINKDNYSASFINSSIDFKAEQEVLNSIYNKKIKMLFIAPEKLTNKYFAEFIINNKPDFLFVDEAHCISEWGHNFRPSFRNIKSFTEQTGITNISAFTATATPEVRQDIIEQLGFTDPKIFVYGFERPNISLKVVISKKKKEKILRLLEKNKNSTIIYTSTRKNAEALTEYLKLHKINCGCYHAGLSTELRKIIQDDFKSNRINVIVATNAFGMGIDKKDIRNVIHYNIPGSIENLYQEFGRAGRDFKEAEATLFYDDKDKYTQEFLINSSFPTYENIKEFYNLLLDYNRIALNYKSRTPLIIDDNLIKLLEIKSIHKNNIISIINILQSSGYLELVSSSNVNHYIKILIQPIKLKNYIMHFSDIELRDFLITIIKFYGNNLFSSKTKLNLNDLENTLQYPYHVIENKLETLVNLGIIEYDRPSIYPKILMSTERIKSERLHINISEIEKKVAHSHNKLQSIIDYVHSYECRFKLILEYFGDFKQDYKCGKCDNCTGNVSSILPENYIEEIIVRTLKEYRGGLTGQRILNILRGTSKSAVAKSISTFANCTNYPKQEIINQISKLLNQKRIKSFDNKYFYDENANLFNTELLETQPSEKSFFDYENDLELFNKLRELRKVLAKKFYQQAEIICPDDTLKEISKSKPTSASQLLIIKGFNKRMFNKIGENVLEVINEHLKTTTVEKSDKYLPKHISQTYHLILRGYSLEEISKLLKLPESIVSIQIENILSYFPNQKINSLIPEDEILEIKNCIQDKNEDLKEIKKKLPSKISYAKIRIVKASLFS